MLKEGEISEVGTYKELLNECKEFADFLVEYIQEEEDKALDKEEQNILNSVKGDLEEVIGSEKLIEEIKKARSVKSGFSNISAYKSDAESIISLEEKPSFKKSDMNESTSLRN